MSKLDMDAIEAGLTLKLKAKSGYSCTADYKISARQWGVIVNLCDKFALENELAERAKATS